MRFHNLVRRAAFFALVVCAVPIFSAWTYGNIISYSPVSGTHFDFTNIQEDPTRLVSSYAYPAELPPSFGQPTGGDTLTFPSITFKSAATNGFDMADSKLSMTISSKLSPTHAPTGIQSVTLTEYGDYFLSRLYVNPDSASSNPVAEAKAIGWVTVEEVNGVAISPFIVVPSLSGAQFDNLFHMPVNSTNPTGGSWNGTLNFNVASAVLEKFGKGVATKVSFTADNTLFTQAEYQSGAYIAKKGVYLSVVPVPVPEPGTFVLLGLGLVSVAGLWIKRRK